MQVAWMYILFMVSLFQNNFIMVLTYFLYQLLHVKEIEGIILYILCMIW